MHKRAAQNRKPETQQITAAKVAQMARGNGNALKDYVRSRLRLELLNPPLSTYYEELPSAFLIETFESSRNGAFKVKLQQAVTELIDSWLGDYPEPDDTDKEYLGELAFLCESIEAAGARASLKAIVDKANFLGGTDYLPRHVESWIWIALASMPALDEERANEAEFWESIWRKAEGDAQAEEAAFTALRLANYRKALGQLAAAYDRACRDDDPFNLPMAIRGLCVQENANMQNMGTAVSNADLSLYRASLIQKGDFVDYVIDTMRELELVDELRAFRQTSDIRESSEPSDTPVIESDRWLPMIAIREAA